VTAQLAVSTAARLGCSPAFAELHAGEHRCYDGERYADGCLVTDPALAARLGEVLGQVPAGER
jgi:hypothetical protein